MIIKYSLFTVYLVILNSLFFRTKSVCAPFLTPREHSSSGDFSSETKITQTPHIYQFVHRRKLSSLCPAIIDLENTSIFGVLLDIDFGQFPKWPSFKFSSLLDFNGSNCNYSID